MSFEPAPPLRVHPRLRAAPRIRDLLWCDFPRDAQMPEMWKRRLVVVLTPVPHYFGTVSIVPLTTVDQGSSPTAFHLAPEITGNDAWVLCDKITNVAVSRLVPNKGGRLRLDRRTFDGMLAVVLDCLPKLPEPGTVYDDEEEDEPVATFRSP